MALTVVFLELVNLSLSRLQDFSQLNIYLHWLIDRGVGVITAGQEPKLKGVHV